MALMGIDIGTTGCKSIVYDETGHILGKAYCEYNIISYDGKFEIDADLVWDSVKSVVKKAVVGLDGDKKVTAIGISSFGESAVAIDKDGNTLGNAILYTDSRGQEECDYVEKLIGRERFMSITKVTPHPMYTLFKVLWQKNNQPEMFAKVFKYLLFEDYIIYRLTGECRISYSESSRTGCFDVKNLCFCDEILNAVGVSKDIFSIPSPAGTVAGAVKKSVSDELGLSDTTLVTTGGQDQICSAIGAGGFKTGLATCGIGTVECITPIFGAPIEDMNTLSKGYCCVPYVNEGAYVTYAYSYTGGAMLKWFRDKIAPELKEECDKNGENFYALIENKINGKISNLLMLPHFAGAATPYMDTTATGAIVGLTLASTREDIFNAILEGCCYEMLLNIEHLKKADIHIGSVTATGGGASSDLWLQMKADIFGFNVSSLENSEAGTIGASILAGVGTGVFSSLEDGVQKMVRIKKTFTPNFEKRALYMKNYNKYKKLHEAVKDIML